MLFPGLPDAIFNPPDRSPLQNLASICQVTETYATDAVQVEVSMMDTLIPSTLTAVSGAPAIAAAITLFTNFQAQATYTGPWNENVSPPLTLSGSVTPGSGGTALGSGQLDSQVVTP